jgi:GntR family transcriptional repressor for pyruvate dehydrogenase complex
MLKPIQTPDAVQLISDQILGLISAGQLKPGDRLPSEMELMAQLGVGRSTVREAKRALAAKGIINARAGRGTFVRTLGTEVLDGTLLRALLSRETLLELQETRDLLEVQVVTLATQRATDEDLCAMRYWLTRMREESPGAHIHTFSVEFHRSLALATHNRVLIQLYHVVEGLLTDYLQPLYAQYADASQEVADHWVLFEAVQARDLVRAPQLMQEHMAQVRAFLAHLPPVSA